MTPAQRKALEWLPADGSWKSRTGKDAPSLNMLNRMTMAYPQHIESSRWGMCYYRLTPLGQKLREEVLKGDADERKV